MSFDDLQFGPLREYLPVLMDGFILTLSISSISIVLGSLLGLLIAVTRSLAPRWAQWPFVAYVEVIRNTPLLVQLLIIFLGLPAIGIRLSPFESSILGLTVNTAAYCSEIFRAGIDATHKSQIEAGLSLGLSRIQVARFVIVPPAAAKVWPALVSQCVLLTLASSVCSFISLEEISGSAYTIQSATFLTLEVYLIIGAMYLALSMFVRVALTALGHLMFSNTSSGLVSNRMATDAVGGQA